MFVLKPQTFIFTSFTCFLKLILYILHLLVDPKNFYFIFQKIEAHLAIDDMDILIWIPIFWFPSKKTKISNYNERNMIKYFCFFFYYTAGCITGFDDDWSKRITRNHFWIPFQAVQLNFISPLLTISPHLHRHNRKIAHIKTEIVFFPL